MGRDCAERDLKMHTNNSGCTHPTGNWIGRSNLFRCSDCGKTIYREQPKPAGGPAGPFSGPMTPFGRDRK